MLSCDEVPTKPLPVTGRPAGIDIGVVTVATPATVTTLKIRAGRRRRPTGGGRQGGGARKRGSDNVGSLSRETVAAQHRKVANRRKDFHHNNPENSSLPVRPDGGGKPGGHEMLRRARPAPDPDNPGQFLPNGARAKSGLNRRISDAGWAHFVSYCAPKRKTLDATGSRSTPGTPRTAAKNAGMQPRKTGSTRGVECQRCGHAPQADEHATHNILGLDCPSH